MTEHTNDGLRDLAEFITENNKVQVLEAIYDDSKPDSAPFLAVPDSVKIHDARALIEGWALKPRRARGTSNHQTVASFLAHVEKFKDANTAIFANGVASDPKVTAVYNYNESQDAPRFGDLRAVLSCQLSDEWRLWTKAAGGNMDQGVFAEFIEANIGDIQDAPDLNDDANAVLREISMTLQYPFASQKQMMGMSKGIEINQSTKAKVQVNLQTGERTLQFESENSGADGARLSIPGLFLIAIPVFKDGHIYRLPVRLRYRANGSGVVWSFDIYRDDKAFKLAYDEVCDSISKQSGLNLYVGSPE